MVFVGWRFGGLWEWVVLLPISLVPRLSPEMMPDSVPSILLSTYESSSHLQPCPSSSASSCLPPFLSYCLGCGEQAFVFCSPCPFPPTGCKARLHGTPEAAKEVGLSNIPLVSGQCLPWAVSIWAQTQVLWKGKTWLRGEWKGRKTGSLASRWAFIPYTRQPQQVSEAFGLHVPTSLPARGLYGFPYSPCQIPSPKWMWPDSLWRIVS